ncbi:MAG: hypothetical protein Q8T09_17620 [Candidatus Melainabacteria bacterium]|nr:hypothetical protein [Candidatus Melainabacteria bacterium]
MLQQQTSTSLFIPPLSGSISSSPLIVPADASFSTLGSLHLHIDGGKQARLAKSIAAQLAKEGELTKVQAVLGAVGGPQRQQLVETYSTRTAGSASQDTIEFFSSVGLRSRQHAIATLKQVLPNVKNDIGIVLDVERVVATVDAANGWKQIEFYELDGFTAGEIDFACSYTQPFEIHHLIDIYDTGENPLDLETLMRDSISMGINLGGWFQFSKTGRAAYRSNAFSQAYQLKSKVMMQHELLSVYLENSGLNYRLRTVIERVLAVCRIR